MATNRITPGGAVRRGLLAALAAIALAAALGACGAGGKGGDETASAPQDKEADAALLNEILGRQLGVVAAYPQGMEGMEEATLVLLRRFRAQESEHADGIVKSLRGLGEEAEADPEKISAGQLKTRDQRLRFIYTMESATIQAELAALGKMASPTPRRLLAATVANQAQHLTILRGLLGADPVKTIPVPFETGNTPAE
jgi:hypothetical protein